MSEPRGTGNNNDSGAVLDLNIRYEFSWTYCSECRIHRTSGLFFACARAIITRFRGTIWQADPGVSSDVQSARADRSPDSDPRSEADPDDRRHARGQGEAQALSREGQKAGRDDRQAHDPGRAWAGQ